MVFTHTDCFGPPPVTLPEVLIFVVAIVFLLIRLNQQTKPVLGVMRHAWYR